MMLLLTFVFGCTAQAQTRKPQKAQPTEVTYSVAESDVGDGQTKVQLDFSHAIAAPDGTQECKNLRNDAKALARNICKIQGVRHVGVYAYMITATVGRQASRSYAEFGVIDLLKKNHPNKQFVKKEQ